MLDNYLHFTRDSEENINKMEVYIVVIIHSYNMMIAKPLELHLHETTVGKETG